MNGLVEATRTLVWDLEDLDDPLLLTEYYSDTQATDHNLYVRGNRLYMTNNRAGLRVLDISDPETRSRSATSTPPRGATTRRASTERGASTRTSRAARS